MATYIWNPDNATTGTNPVGNGWTMRCLTFDTSSIVETATPMGAKVWRYSVTSGSADYRAALFDEYTGGTEEQEVLTLQRRTVINSEMGSTLRLATSGNSDFIFCGLRNEATQLRYRERANCTTTVSSLAALHGLATTLDTWLWVRARVTGTSAVRVKIWEDGATEPEEWLVEATGLTIGHSTGGVGIGGYETTSSGQTDLAWFSVGTAGDPAPDTDAEPRKITITDLKDPNAANAQVEDGTGVQVKLWIDKDDVGAPDVVVTDATITGGTMEVTFASVAAVGAPVLGVAKFSVTGTDYFFPIDTTVEDV